MASNEDRSTNEIVERRRSGSPDVPGPTQGGAITNEVPFSSAQEMLERSRSMPQLQRPNTRSPRVISQEELDFVESLKERSITPLEHEVKKCGEVTIVRTLSQLVGSERSFVDDEEESMAGDRAEEKSDKSSAEDMELPSTIGTDTHQDEDNIRSASSVDIRILEKGEKKHSPTGPSDEAAVAQITYDFQITAEGKKDFIGDIRKESLVEPTEETAEFTVAVDIRKASRETLSETSQDSTTGPKEQKAISFGEPTYAETTPILAEYEGAPEEVWKAPEPEAEPVPQPKLVGAAAMLPRRRSSSIQPPTSTLVSSRGSLVKPEETALVQPPPLEFKPPEEPAAVEPSYTADITPLPSVHEEASEQAGEVQALSIEYKPAKGISFGEPTYAETTPILAEYEGAPEEVWKAPEPEAEPVPQPKLVGAAAMLPRRRSSSIQPPTSTLVSSRGSLVKPEETALVQPPALEFKPPEEPTAVDTSYTAEEAPVPPPYEEPEESAVEPSYTAELAPVTTPYQVPEEPAMAEPSYTTEPALFPEGFEAPKEPVIVEPSYTSDITAILKTYEEPEEIAAVEPSYTAAPAPVPPVHEEPSEQAGEKQGPSIEYKPAKGISFGEPTYAETTPILAEYEGAPEEVWKGPEPEGVKPTEEPVPEPKAIGAAAMLPRRRSSSIQPPTSTLVSSRGSLVKSEETSLVQPPALEFKPPEAPAVEPSYAAEPAPVTPGYAAPEEPAVVEPSYTADITPLPSVHEEASEQAGEVQAPSIEYKPAKGISFGEPTYAETTPILAEYEGAPEEVWKGPEPEEVKPTEEPVPEPKAIGAAAMLPRRRSSSIQPPTSTLVSSRGSLVKPEETALVQPPSLEFKPPEELAVEKPSDMEITPSLPGHVEAPEQIGEAQAPAAEYKPEKEIPLSEPTYPESTPVAAEYEGTAEEVRKAPPPEGVGPAEEPALEPAAIRVAAMQPRRRSSIIPVAPSLVSSLGLEIPTEMTEPVQDLPSKYKPPEDLAAVEPSYTEAAPITAEYEHAAEELDKIPAVSPEYKTSEKSFVEPSQIVTSPVIFLEGSAEEAAKALVASSEFLPSKERPIVEPSYYETTPTLAEYDWTQQEAGEFQSPPFWYDSPADVGAPEPSEKKTLGAVHDEAPKQAREVLETSVEYLPATEIWKEPSYMETTPLLVYEGTYEEAAQMFDASLELSAGMQPSKETLKEPAPRCPYEPLAISVLRPEHDEPLRVLAGMPVITEPTKLDHLGAEERTLTVSAPWAPPRSFAEDTEVPKVGLAWEAELSKPSEFGHKIQRVHGKKVAKLSIVLRDNEPMVTSNTSNAEEHGKEDDPAELVLEYVACEEQVLEGIIALDDAGSEGAGPASSYQSMASHSTLALSAVEDRVPDSGKDEGGENPSEKLQPDAE